MCDVILRWCYKLAESTARRQLKSPRPLSGRSIHLTSPNDHGHGHEWPTSTPCVQCQSALPFWDTAISKFDHENPWSRSYVWSKVKVTFVWPSNFKGQDYGQGQSHWSHLRPGVQSICLLFVSWQSDHFWLRYRKFQIWPWKSKAKVMAKVKPYGHILGPGIQSIFLLFVPWQSDHFWLRYSKFHIWPWKFKVTTIIDQNIIR